MGGDNPRRLVVEGYDDLYSVREIMRTHIEWPDTNESEYPVYIDIGYGVNEILNENYMGVLLKSPTIKNLGIMIDADEKRAWQRYRSLYDLCRASFPDMPDTLPFEGLVVNNAPAEKRLGIWIMPDNRSQGDLETFLRDLVPDQPLWEYAERCTESAKKDWNAPYRNAHTNKAKLYSWLSWQDPPVQNPGRALRSGALDATVPATQTFIKWFRKLYDL